MIPVPSCAFWERLSLLFAYCVLNTMILAIALGLVWVYVPVLFVAENRIGLLPLGLGWLANLVWKIYELFGPRPPRSDLPAPCVRSL